MLLKYSLLAPRTNRMGAIQKGKNTLLIDAFVGPSTESKLEI